MKKIILILAIVLAGSAVDAQHIKHSTANESNSKQNVPLAKHDQYIELNKAMRKLWSDHMHWTLATVDAFFNEPQQLNVKLNRLLVNQKQIGAAIVPFYGEAAGDKLTKLLSEHIEGAVPVLKAAQTNDKTGLDQALAAWYKNAKEIAGFLSSANPANWPVSVTEPALKMHITHTTAYAVNILTGDYASSIKGFEEALDHMLMLADVLSEGIVRQFPDKFKK